MKFPFFSIAAGALLLAGCGNNTSNPTQTTNTSSSPPSAPAPSGDNYGSALANAQNRAIDVVGMTALQEAIRNFNVNEGRYPKDLDELVSSKFLAKIPPAPRGKRFNYNAATGDIKLVDQ
jgi:hypothetical protein